MSELIDGATWLWDKFRSERKSLEESKLSLSKQVREAITETEIYLTSVNRNQRRDLESEVKLARIWSLVSAEVAPKHEEISNICLCLSRYWSNTRASPTEFDEEIRELVYVVLWGGKEAGVFYRG
ncbi:hypothetical protein [Ectothiorhodospira haloalkaliphila]|uniref:hypothetical protein n=1 Tax=Ectothiorhodospira haloalkaliphila TaxID=421628 RepID=UPI000FFB23E0|nr:hypothetical protein [Ectothiorhodospira haloalkaliphila]